MSESSGNGFHADDPSVVTYAKRNPLAPTGSSGVDGESYESYGINSGYDFSASLSGRAKYAVFNEMRRSDPACRSLLWMFKLPARAAEWSVEDVGDGADPTDRLIADTIRRQFGLDGHDGRLDLSWDDSVAQALLMLDWGAMFEEMIWGDPEEYRDDEGASRFWRPLLRLAPRAPASIHEIISDTATGGIASIEQDLPGASRIPGSKLAWYVLEHEGDDWLGTSVLRACVGTWRLKRGHMVSAGIAFDRYAAGIPLIRYPPNDEKARDRAEKIGANMRVHERAWVALPGRPPPEGDWDVSILSGSSSIADPVPMLRHYDQQMAMSALQMMAGLGTTDTGSRAVGETLSEPYYMAVEGIVDSVKDARRRQIWRRFIDVNFGAEYDVPKLKVAKIQGKSIQVLAAALANLSSAGFSFGDRETQDDVRSRLELPLSPDEAATVDALPASVGIVPVGSPIEGAGLGL